MLTPISKEMGLTLTDPNAGTGYMFLFFGWVSEEMVQVDLGELIVPRDVCSGSHLPYSMANSRYVSPDPSDSWHHGRGSTHQDERPVNRR